MRKTDVMEIGLVGEREAMEIFMKLPATETTETKPVEAFSRRSAIGTFLAVLAASNFTPWTISSSQSQPQGAKTMSQYAVNQKTIGDAVANGGVLVVAQWEAKEGQADNVAGILDRFLPEAQRDPGSQLFLIGRNKENPAQFLFYELFRDEAAFKAHQESNYFKTYIAGQALPLLAKRERTQYVLL
ncbi:Quinol monooxygenase YgiN [Bradyrhizobium erythrophlei]|uniref:Quinol monooxygenase YgiN n=2 Tax=Bradyrhizobium erythrophlei TaxID=1437360 RepID=A0A1M7UUX3_9BRAD|nr:Quinol monooxygenase YgiN [Bradyrhizobium erythrophlei]